MATPEIDLARHLDAMDADHARMSAYEEWQNEAEDDVRRALEAGDTDWLAEVIGADPHDEGLFSLDKQERGEAFEKAAERRFDEIKAYREGY